MRSLAEFSTRRPKATSAPAAANATAMERPSPRAAPVTRAVCPAREKFGICELVWVVMVAEILHGCAAAASLCLSVSKDALRREDAVREVFLVWNERAKAHANCKGNYFTACKAGSSQENRKRLISGN